MTPASLLAGAGPIGEASIDPAGPAADRSAAGEHGGRFRDLLVEMVELAQGARESSAPAAALAGSVDRAVVELIGMVGDGASPSEDPEQPDAEAAPPDGEEPVLAVALIGEPSTRPPLRLEGAALAMKADTELAPATNGEADAPATTPESADTAADADGRRLMDRVRLVVQAVLGAASRSSPSAPTDAPVVSHGERPAHRVAMPTSSSEPNADAAMLRLTGQGIMHQPPARDMVPATGRSPGGQDPAPPATTEPARDAALADLVAPEGEDASQAALRAPLRSARGGDEPAAEAAPARAALPAETAASSTDDGAEHPGSARFPSIAPEASPTRPAPGTTVAPAFSVAPSAAPVAPRAEPGFLSALNGAAAPPPGPPPAPATATTLVTLPLDTALGAAARLRVALRGDAVHATILVDAPAVAAIARQLPELQQALRQHGFQDSQIVVRAPGAESVAAAAPSRAESSNAGRADGEPRDEQHTRAGQRRQPDDERPRHHQRRRDEEDLG